MDGEEQEEHGHAGGHVGLRVQQFVPGRHVAQGQRRGQRGDPLRQFGRLGRTDLLPGLLAAGDGHADGGEAVGERLRDRAGDVGTVGRTPDNSRIHAYYIAAEVEEGAARVAVIDGGVGLNHRLYVAAHRPGQRP